MMKKIQKRLFQTLLITLVGTVTLALIPQASILAFRQLIKMSQYGNAAINHAKKLTENTTTLLPTKNRYHSDNNTTGSWKKENR